jgi:hypothetical protein
LFVFVCGFDFVPVVLLSVFVLIVLVHLFLVRLAIVTVVNALANVPVMIVCGRVGHIVLVIVVRSEIGTADITATDESAAGRTLKARATALWRSRHDRSVTLLMRENTHVSQAPLFFNLWSCKWKQMLVT